MNSRNFSDLQESCENNSNSEKKVIKIKQCPINTENPNKGVCPFGFHLLGQNNSSGRKLSDTSLAKN